MTTTDTSDTDKSDQSAHLSTWAAPGSAAFGRSAAWEATSTVAAIVLWGAVAALVFTALHSRPSDAGWAAAVIGAAGLGGALSRRLAAGAADRGRHAIAAQLRARLIASLLPETPTTRPVLESADAAATLQEQVDDIADHLADSIPLRRAAGVSMLLIFATVALVHWPVAIILLLCTALMPLNLSLAGRTAQDASNRRLDEMRRLSAAILESFHGMPTLRALRATRRRRDDLALASERLESATMSVLRWAFISSVIMDVLITFSIATCATYVGLVLLGYVVIPVAPHLDLFSGLWVLTLCPLFFVPLRRTAASFHQRDRARAAAVHVAAVLVTSAGASAAPVAAALASAPRVSVTELTVRHGGADSPVIDAVDLDVPAGQWTVIVGPSGAGKSTLLRALAGIQPPASGAVAWDADGESRPPELGSAVWVGQQTVILDGTIAENIRLGRPEAADGEVWDAADAAGLRNLLAGLPDGLATRIGDGGIGISTGEARRVAVARGMLKGSRLWFLDEPTAHLDAATERDVLTGLRRATDGATVIAVTHSALLSAEGDRLWQLTDGRLEAAEVRR